jgi:hypothetical protein
MYELLVCIHPSKCENVPQLVAQMAVGPGTHKTRGCVSGVVVLCMEVPDSSVPWCLRSDHGPSFVSLPASEKKTELGEMPTDMSSLANLSPLKLEA